MSKRNVGKIDRSLRFLLGLLLLWSGLFPLDGISGELLGIVLALSSILPFYMALTASCFVFRWLRVHSLSKSECMVHGKPYVNK